MPITADKKQSICQEITGKERKNQNRRLTVLLVAIVATEKKSKVKKTIANDRTKKHRTL